MPEQAAPQSAKKTRKEKSIQSFSRFVQTKNRDLEDMHSDRQLGPYRCFGTHLGDILDLNKIYDTLKKDYRINCFCDQHQVFEVLHVQYQQQGVVDSEIIHVDTGEALDQPEEFRISRTKDAFFFREGGVVCWGMDPHEEKSWIDSARPYVPVIPDAPVLQRPTIEESMNVYRGPRTSIRADNIILSTRSTNKAHEKEMLAYSYGIARSMQLETIEEEMGWGNNSITERVLATPKIIKQGKLPDRVEWTKITGELMELRCKVNLNSTLLDVPDLFWDDYDMGTLFQEMQANLEITDRIDTLNKRLDMIEQIISTVQSSLTDKYSHKLEVIIIILITIEVVFYLADKNEYWSSLRWDLTNGITVSQSERKHRH